MSADRFFAPGIQNLRAAVEADNAGKYPEALKLYIKAFEYMLTGIKCSVKKNTLTK